MSRTKKEGKRRRIPSGKKSEGIQSAVMKRHVYGSTEKILRRNRKTWTRLANKRRRAEDKLATDL